MLVEEGVNAGRDGGVPGEAQFQYDIVHQLEHKEASV